MTATVPLLLVVQEVQVDGPPPQDPGLLLPLVPAVLFLLLAALTWWIWRHLADD